MTETTDRHKGLLTPSEANALEDEHYRREGIPRNTRPKYVNGHPPIGLHSSCECKGLGVVRVDLPLGHPHFGRLAVCRCSEVSPGWR